MYPFLSYFRARYFKKKFFPALSFLKHGLSRHLYMHAMLKEDDYVIDVGAHIGYYTTLFSQRVGKNGLVVAFEPNPYAFAILKKNTKRKKNVKIHSLAVSEHASDEVSFWVRPFSLAQDASVEKNLLKGFKKGIKVKTLSLDDLALPSLKFIKIDAEGHEFSILKGAENLLQKHQPIVLFEYGVDPMQNERSTIEFMRTRRGYRCFDAFTFEELLEAPKGAVLTDILAVPQKHLERSFELFHTIQKLDHGTGS